MAAFAFALVPLSGQIGWDRLLPSSPKSVPIDLSAEGMLIRAAQETYQKLKKSLTSFSVVSWAMPLTLTVLPPEDMIAVCSGVRCAKVICVVK
jgi:hypothetical protein